MGKTGKKRWKPSRSTKNVHQYLLWTFAIFVDFLVFFVSLVIFVNFHQGRINRALRCLCFCMHHTDLAKLGKSSRYGQTRRKTRVIAKKKRIIRLATTRPEKRLFQIPEISRTAPASPPLCPPHFNSTCQLQARKKSLFFRDTLMASFGLQKSGQQPRTKSGVVRLVKQPRMSIGQYRRQIGGRRLLLQPIVHVGF